MAHKPQPELSGYLSGQGDLPNELQAQIEHHGGTPLPKAALGIIGIGGMALFVVSLASLFFFWGPARYTAFSLVLFDLILGILDPLVEFGWVAALSHLEAFLTGIVLSLAFCSPLAASFKKKREAKIAS